MYVSHIESCTFAFIKCYCCQPQWASWIDDNVAAKDNDDNDDDVDFEVVSLDVALFVHTVAVVVNDDDVVFMKKIFF